MRRLIIFLIRKRLGLAEYERFQFANQKSDAVYWFTEIGVMKKEKRNNAWVIRPSRVSLNWLLDINCAVISCKEKEAE